MTIAAGGFLAGLLVFAVLLYAGLPNAEEIKNYRPESTITPASIDWSTLPDYPVRMWVPLDQISPWLQKAVILSEDDLFYQHEGINFDMMWEAFKVNWERGRYARGASTLTMQLARNAFLHKRKTLLRKLKEMILARRLEQHLSKQRILELYLNVVEWGENIYGAEAASRYYFGKAAADLNLAQASLLASMLPNPKYFNPFKRYQSCKRMQERVLWLMEISRVITEGQLKSAFAQTVHLRGQKAPETPAPIDSLVEAQYALPDTLHEIPVPVLTDTVSRDTFSEIKLDPSQVLPADTSQALN